jgi:hypothetical protein
VKNIGMGGACYQKAIHLATWVSDTEFTSTVRVNNGLAVTNANMKMT